MFSPFPIGALLGGDLNNSNGGCPSPVRKFSSARPDHMFTRFWTFWTGRVFLRQTLLWKLICILSKPPPPHHHPPNTSFLLCTICDGAWRDEGMPLVTITGMHGNPCTLPTDMPCALYSTSQYYGLSKSFKVLWKNDIFLCLFIYLILKIQQWDSHLHHWLLYSSDTVWSLRYLKIEKLWWDYF